MRISHRSLSFDTVFQEEGDIFSWKGAAESIAHLR